ncbi:hypothetical protein [Actinopolymorpha pittospori]|uniref:Uncharacterized protein n=1 Tax=Actinopolymorpha pittospori TaxID=648752 RepID=A0A927RJ13_9ACTN|nr:hypothetical protein [Actinopolymorpha pittospori]MBE1606751.1 hypothetical protein [Actinopolymorpha pittospori]
MLLGVREHAVPPGVLGDRRSETAGHRERRHSRSPSTAPYDGCGPTKAHNKAVEADNVTVCTPW